MVGPHLIKDLQRGIFANKPLLERIHTGCWDVNQALYLNKGKYVNYRNHDPMGLLAPDSTGKITQGDFFLQQEKDKRAKNYNHDARCAKFKGRVATPSDFRKPIDKLDFSHIILSYLVDYEKHVPDQQKHGNWKNSYGRTSICLSKSGSSIPKTMEIVNDKKHYKIINFLKK